MSRFGAGAPTSARWDVRRMNDPNPLWGSNGVAFGPDGRLHVAQYLAGTISAVDLATGEVEVVEPVEGPVQSPDDLAFGADGSMYITDLAPGRVWRRGPAGDYALVSDAVAVPNGIACVGDRLFVNEMRMGGRLLELFPGGGEPVALAGGLALGNAMQQGPDGALYYPHMLTNQVFRTPLDGGPAELVAEDVHEPVAVRFDRDGVLHVVSRGAQGIVTRFDGDRRTLVTSGILGLDNAAFDEENRMFVSSYASGGIAELHPDGRTRQVVPRGLAGPYGLTVDFGGQVLAADHYRVARPSPEGFTADEFLIFAHGVATTPDGHLHLTSQFGDVRTHDPATGETTIRAHSLNRPTGIAVRPDGALLVAETGAGRVLAITDEVAVLAEGLDSPVDVTVDDDGRCYATTATAVVRLDDTGPVVIADDLAAPQGVAAIGDTLYVVEVGAKRLRSVSVATGETHVEVEDLAVGTPAPASTTPPLYCHGMPGVAPQFAGLAAGGDGTLFLSANGEGTVLHLRPRA
ncbi:hypothetical protein ACOBQX_00265 [Actinokineospora sp. G85]|uniref:hypothetical protein n=1 Tax=Actinokineospora sp. G85 TaxID=3406626 RepID=UPI003C740CED